MATRALIGYTLPNGNVRGTYCHLDGYPAHLGKILMDGFSSSHAIDALTQWKIRFIDTDFVPEYLKTNGSGVYVEQDWWTNSEIFLNDFRSYKTNYNYLWLSDKKRWVVSTPNNVTHGLMHIVLFNTVHSAYPNKGGKWACELL